MIRVVGGLRRVLDRLGTIMNAVAGWVFVLCALFIVFDVVGRRWGISSKATVEITGYMLAFGIAWGLTDALTTRAHVRVDIVVTRLPLRARAWMHALALAFLVTLNAVLAWRCWGVVEDSWLFGARDSSALTIPLVVPQGLWALGITVFAALSALTLLEVLLLLLGGRAAEVDRRLGPRTVGEETRDALHAAAMAERA
jgi:TRAP-type mannitol/chloroaromatic compound transport system permease small subunit